jgi:hypothetical protein
MTQRTWELFQQADPARGVPVHHGDVEALLGAAAGDVTPETGSLRHRRRQPPRLLVAGVAFAAVAAVSATVLVLRPSPGAGPAAQPVPHSPGLPCLTAIADDLRPAPYDGRSGRYEYQRMLAPDSADTMIGDKQYTVQWTEERSQWLAGDGSGRIRTVRTGFGYPNAASRTFYAQHPDQVPNAGTQTEQLAKAEYQPSPMPAADPEAMRKQLYQPRENGPGEALVGVEDLNRAWIIDAAHRVALLRFLATTAGLNCAGAAQDPAGRTGVMVGSTITPTPGNRGSWNNVLMFDPSTGELLDSGRRVGAGPVTWFTQWLARDFQATLG